MITTGLQIPKAVDADAASDLEEMARQLAAIAIPDPDLVRRIRERAAQARAELEATVGVQNVGVSIIREMRDGIVCDS